MPKRKRYKGTIKFFSNISGEGMIRHKDHGDIHFYSCNAIGSKSGFSHLSCIEFKKGQEVEFEVHEALGAVKVSGGTFNEKKYKKLNVADSAFQLDENGRFKTGLFRTE